MNLKTLVDLFVNRPGLSSQTRVKYDYKLRPFVRLWGDCPVTAINGRQLSNWFEQQSDYYAPATLSIYRAVLLALFNFALEEKLIDQNPAAKLPSYSDRPRLIICANEAAVSTVLAFCEQVSQGDDPYLRRDAAIFALAASSGGRRSNLKMAGYREAVHVLANPIEDEAGLIYALPVGGKTEVDLIFGEWPAAILRRYLAIRPETRHNRLFVHLHPDRGTLGEPLGDRGFNLARLRICEAAGVKAITFTALRKLRGTQLARRYGLELAALALGHSSGTRVIREFYYDPDRHAARVATLRSAPLPLPLVG
jgi:integrase